MVGDPSAKNVETNPLAPRRAPDASTISTGRVVAERTGLPALDHEPTTIVELPSRILLW
jgi:hypothetical protein